jgi:hypothetical protein
MALGLLWVIRLMFPCVNSWGLRMPVKLKDFDCLCVASLRCFTAREFLSAPLLRVPSDSFLESCNQLLQSRWCLPR